MTRPLVLTLLLLAACSKSPEASAPAPAAAGGPVALFIGDSLTAGYGVEPRRRGPRSSARPGRRAA